jgi:hypothetical protein
MDYSERSYFIKDLQAASRKEWSSWSVYQALAQRETNKARRKSLLDLAETERGHAQHWVARLHELGVELPATMIALPHQQLAETLDVYGQTKQAHSTVKGTSFYQLHLLFGNMATRLVKCIDPIAERGMAPGGEGHNAHEESSPTHDRNEHDIYQPCPSEISMQI